VRSALGPPPQSRLRVAPGPPNGARLTNPVRTHRTHPPAHAHHHADRRRPSDKGAQTAASARPTSPISPVASRPSKRSKTHDAREQMHLYLLHAHHHSAQQRPSDMGAQTALPVPTKQKPTKDHKDAAGRTVKPARRGQAETTERALTTTAGSGVVAGAAGAGSGVAAGTAGAGSGVATAEQGPVQGAEPSPPAAEIQGVRAGPTLTPTTSHVDVSLFKSIHLVRPRCIFFLASCSHHD
jgi:hypothetical protein